MKANKKENNKIYVLYTCDEWKSHDSMSVYAVGTDLDKLGAIARERINKVAEEEDNPALIEAFNEYLENFQDDIISAINVNFDSFMYLDYCYNNCLI